MWAALDGFLSQTLRSSSIEIILVTGASVRVAVPARLRKLKIRRVAWPRRKGLAAAINIGAAAAKAPVLLLMSPRWRPLPGLADYCLSFHAQQQGAADTLMLATTLDPEHVDDPLTWWLDQQQLAGLNTLSAGIHNWRGLRFDALSAKKDLLTTTPLPEGEGDEWLIKTEWARLAPVRVFAEPVSIMATAGRSDLGAVMDAEYAAARARVRAMRAASQAFANDSIDDRFQNPGKYILSAADRRELLKTVELLEQELAGRDPRFAVGAEAEQFEMLGKLYLVAISHARSSGWVVGRK